MENGWKHKEIMEKGGHVEITFHPRKHPKFRNTTYTILGEELKEFLKINPEMTILANNGNLVVTI